MPTVPVGNKQIGEFTGVVTVSTPNTTIHDSLLQGSAVVQTTTIPTPSSVENKQIGEFTGVVTVSTPNPVVHTSVIQGLAVVVYAPPSSIKTSILQGIAVVKDTVAINTQVDVENKQIGEFSSIVTVSTPNDTISCSIIQGLAVVQEYQPRKELTIFNIDYAADAKFNTPTQ